MHRSAKPLLLESWAAFRRVWPQLAVTDLLARALGLTILTPLVGLLLELFLATTSTGVVADAAIVTFLLHPLGLVALLVVVSVSLALLFAETGQLMVIAYGELEDRRVTWLEALGYSFRHGRALLQLAVWAVIRLLLLALPFLVALGALYGVFLGAHDINYYLAEKPPAFVWVAGTAGVLLAALGVLMLTRIAGWLMAVPMVLFEGQSGRQALEASRRVTAPHRTRLALWLVAWMAGVIVVFALVTLLLGAVANLVVPRSAEHVRWLLVALGTLLIVGGAANLVVSVLATTVFPVWVVRLYRLLSGPGRLQPELGTPGSLGSKPAWGIPGKPILWSGGAIVLAIGVLVYVALNHWNAGDDAIIIAHRGGGGVAPENTLAAFDRGMADGADWLELDVQEDADGEVVVAHDRDFMRVANRKTEVWQAHRSDLADLDIGSFFDARFSDQRVPTLREVLLLAKGRAGVFIELKYYGHARELERKVVELVEATGMVSSVVIMSLDYDGLRKAAALRPGWTYGLLNAVALGDLTRLDVGFLALTAKAASPGMLRRAHQRGMKVYAWTVDDPVQMLILLSRGVDGIITDQVSVARRVFEVRRRLTPLGCLLVWWAGEAGLLRGMGHASDRDDA